MPSGDTPLVLIADANEDRRLNLSHLLRQDFQVIEARRGEECLTKYQQYQPQVVLIDAVSPVVDGYNLCRQIRRLSPSALVFVLMMVPNEAGAIELAFKAGATDCLIPPIHNDSLRYRLQQWLATQKLVARNHEKNDHSSRDFLQAPDGMYRITLDGRFLEVNPALVHILGYESEDEVLTLKMPQDVFVDETPPKSLPEMVGIYDVIQGTDRVWQRRDGERIIVNLRDRIVRDEQNGIVYIEGLVQDVTGRRRTEQMLESIVKGTATKIGDEFFVSVLQYLVAVSGVKHAYVGELVDRKIHVIALWSGKLVDRDITFSIENTPAETVITQGKAYYPLRTWELFPQDKSLRKHDIEAYMGTALYDADGQALGLIAIMHSEILDNPADAEAILAIFAARVGAELERKRIELALRDRELRFRKVIENAFDFVVLSNADGATQYVSPEFEEILGYDAETLVGKIRYDLIHPEDREWVARDFESMTKEPTGSHRTLQYRVQHQDGSWRWLESRSINMLDEAGVKAIVSHFRDITDTKLREIALWQSEARFRHISEISSDYAFALQVLPDKTFALEWITEIFMQITGLATDVPLTYSDWLSVTHPDDMLELTQHLETLLNVAISIETEYRIRAKDGGIRHIVGQMRSVRDETQNRITRIYGTARDITEQKLAQISEREQRQLAEALLETASKLSSTLDLEVIIEQVLETVGTVVPHDAANIMLVEAKGARVAHGRGYPSEFDGSIGTNVMPLATYSLATMIETGQPYLVSDTTIDPHWVESLSKWTRSYLGAPIQTVNKFIGFLNLNARTAHFFTEDHARRLQAFADQMAIAMENAWLFEQANIEIEERKAAEKMVQQREAILKAVSFAAEQFLRSPNWRDVIQVILEHLGQAAGVSRVYVFEGYIDQDERSYVRYSYEWVAEGIEAFIDDPQMQGYDMHADGLGRWLDLLQQNKMVYGHIREMPEHDHPVMVAQSIVSIALVPIFVKGKWWGFMGFDACVVERPWRTAELDALQTAANIMGGAIEQQQVEAAVRESETKFRAIFENAGIGIDLVDENGTVLQVNQAFQEMLGYSADEVIGKSFAMYIHPDNIEQDLAQFNRIVQGAADEFNIEQQYQRKDGRDIWGHLNVSTVRNEDGTLRYSIGMIKDITSRKQIEAQIKRRNLELEALRSIALAVGSTLKLDEVLHMLLTQLRELVPYESASIALIDDNRLHFVAWQGFPDHTDFAMLEETLREKMMERLKEMGQGYIMVGHTQDLSDWVRIPNVLENIRSWLGIALVHRGKILGMLNLDHSEPNFYTEAHAALGMAVAQQAANAIENARLYGELKHQVIERTAELTVQRGQTELILTSVADGIILLDTDGTIQYVNPAWEYLTGYSAEEVLETVPYFWINDIAQQRMFEGIRHQVMGGEIWRGIIPIVHKHGAGYQVETILAPIVDEAGRIFQLVGVQRDVTEARRIEAMKTRFIADAAHDLGNPVATLQLRLFLLEADPDNMSDHLKVISHQVERLEALSTNLLMLSRLDRGILPTAYEQFDLNTLIERIVAEQLPLAQRKGIVLTFVPNTTLSTIVGSIDQLERVLVNLVQNAVNYTPENGKIVVATDADEKWVRFSVTDTGIGILVENRARIFERFFRSDRVRSTTEGTGLGLSIVKEIVELHRGKIEVESVLDKGSTFTVFLPNST